MAFAQAYPQVSEPIVDITTGMLTQTWQFFLLSLFNRTGGAVGNDSSTFLYPTSTGAAGQVLTSEGASTATIWTSPKTSLSQFTNDIGFITSANLVGLASSNNPTFSGTPVAPTAAANTSTNQIATTAFVLNQGAIATPLLNGTAAIGTSHYYARQDHVHPVNTVVTVNNTVTITSGNGAPSGAQPNSSLYLRRDGSTGSRVYVSNGTTWTAISSV